MTVLAEPKPNMVQRDGWLCHGGPTSACCNPECGWRGNAVVNGERTDFCPMCERDHPGSPWDVGTQEFMKGLSTIALDVGFERAFPSNKVKQRRVEKVARNSPCPCGSGNKTKKCHPEHC